MILPNGASDLLSRLLDAGVEFIVVGGGAAVMQGAPITTRDLDIVHARSPDNVERLLRVLLDVHAFDRADLAKRRLPPRASALSGRGHLLFETDLGELDVLCEIDGDKGYEALLPHARELRSGDRTVLVLDLPMLIEVKARAGRAKDRWVLPLLIATLEERERQPE